MVYDNNLIDINLIEHYKTLFEEESRYYEYGTKLIYNDSYLNNCSDEYIKVMAFNVKRIYDEIENSYKSILCWWNDYLTNAKALEDYISSNASLGSISDSVIRNFVSYKLSPLTKTRVELSQVVTRL